MRNGACARPVLASLDCLAANIADAGLGARVFADGVDRMCALLAVIDLYTVPDSGHIIIPCGSVLHSEILARSVLARMWVRWGHNLGANLAIAGALAAERTDAYNEGWSDGHNGYA